MGASDCERSYIPNLVFKAIMNDKAKYKDFESETYLPYVVYKFWDVSLTEDAFS